MAFGRNNESKVQAKPAKRQLEQMSLFGDSDFQQPATTAIYPNRIRDKWHVETVCKLAEFGDAETVFLTPKGNVFAIGYVRIVYGDHGPYVEFEKSHVVHELVQKFPGSTTPPEAYYEWLEPTDRSGVKVYDQKRDVKGIKNAPAGGFQGNRAEGYADYVPGKIYVSPFELKIGEEKA